MSKTIAYTSSREEIWNWYCRMWRRELWKGHLLLFIVAAILLSPILEKSVMNFLTSLLIPVLILLGLFIFPILNFKPQLRTLTIDGRGLSTFIGKRSGSVKWDQIANIEEIEDVFIIQRTNLNAFLVPSRAFSSSEEKQAFHDYVRHLYLSR
jgi:hypothetical protein